MRYGSVCSGIEAATVAWHPLGWRPAWFSEIDKFPCAVLQHHYPTVPLHGDFVDLIDKVRAGEVEAPDVLVGGTPCQDFSVAGLRQSLSGDRGNLTLQFVRLADAIDDIRRSAGKPPVWIVWENVPGVLSVGDNAFGNFLGGLCGSNAAIAADRVGGWSDAGVVSGPRRCAAWRTMDAQYFKLAQRRARVFVVAVGSTRGWAAADALLPIVESRSWHPAPRRKARAGVARSLTASTGGASAKEQQHTFADGAGQPLNDLEAFGGNNTQGAISTATALRAKGGTGHGDFESETFIAHTLRADGYDASEDGSNRGTPLVVVPMPVGCAELAPTIDASYGRLQGCSGQDGNHGHAHLVPVAFPIVDPIPFDVTQITSAQNRSNPQPGDPMPPLVAEGKPPAIAFTQKDYGQDASEDIAPTLRGMSEVDGNPNGGGQIAVAFESRQDPITYGDNAGPLLGAQDQGQAIALQCQGGDVGTGDTPGTLRAGNGGLTGGVPAVGTATAVRRLTPRECERLQGFPDDYTAIPYRGGIAADGPRYKALGNSMAVPVMRYIGERVAIVAGQLQVRAAE